MPFRLPFSLWLKWTLYCGVGEFLGIATAAAIAVLFNRLINYPQNISEITLLYLAATISGIVEGGITGSLQAKILSPALSVSVKKWVMLTTAVAVLGWLGGTTPSIIVAKISSTADTPIDLTFSQMSFYALAMGLIAGVLFGLFQWFELKNHVNAAWRWIAANAVGWALAMVVIFWGATTPDANTPAIVIIAIGALVGILAGLIVGAATGVSLLAFTREKNHSKKP